MVTYQFIHGQAIEVIRQMIIMGTGIVIQGINAALADIGTARNELSGKGFSHITQTKAANPCISINWLVVY